MRVVSIQQNEVQFGSIKASKEVKDYIARNFTIKQMAKLDKFITEQKDKKPDIILNMHQNAGFADIRQEIIARVEEKMFNINGFFNNSFGNIKNAVKYARDIQKHLGKTITEFLDTM